MRQFASVSMEIVKTGNFSKTIDIKNNDEIGEAANAFNLMVSNTKEAFTEIEGLFSKVAEGDLTARIHKEFRGDIGRSAAHIPTSLQNCCIIILVTKNGVVSQNLLFISI